MARAAYWLASCVIAQLAFPCDSAHAAEARRFAIPAKPVAEALIDFAVQAGISVGGTVRCRGVSPALVGSFTIGEGLGRLLAGSDCRFELVDANTVRISPAPRPVEARPHPAPSPPRLRVEEAPQAAPEVIVTATRRPASMDRLPDAVDSIGRDQLWATGATSAGDVAQQLASITVTNLGPGRNKILFRGLSDGTFTGRTKSTVGTYLDQVPITYNAPDPDLRLADVDRIEIVRGPQGALYGGGSLAGVYRIVTRKPQAGRTFGRLTGLAGFTEGGSPSWETEGVFNTPLGSDRLLFRGVAYGEAAGGYLDDLNLRISNVDRTTRIGGRAAFRFQATPSWTVNLTGAVQQIQSADTQYVTLVEGQRMRANQVRETHRNNFAEAMLDIEGEGHWGRFESSTAFVRHSFASRYDASAALSRFGDDDSQLGVYDEPVQVEKLVQDVILLSPADRRLTWLAGAFASTSLERSQPFLSSRGFYPEPRPLYQEHRTDRLQELAGYGELSYALLPRLTLAGGLRAFLTTVHTRSQVVTQPPALPRLFDDDASFKGLSPKVSLSYEASSNLLLYGLASQGYRPGGFNTGGLITPARLFRSDSLWNFETGAKASFWNGRLKLETALFYVVWRDIQTDQYLRSGLSYTDNVGDARNLGWESELTWRPTARLMLQASSIVNRPELTRSNPASPAQPHLGLPGVPDLSFSLLGIYERPLRGDYSLLLSAEASYVGHSRLTFDPALSPTMGGYGSAKISAQLKTPRWRLALFLSNPANVSGDTFAYGNPFSFGPVRQVTPQRPRTVSLLLSADF